MFKEYNFFVRLRTYFFEKDLTEAIYVPTISKEKMTPKQHVSYQDAFVKAKMISPSVQQLLDTVFSMHSSLRIGYVSEWMKYLTRRALVLIKYVEKET